jgi:plasmid stabilization system protein ParE
MAARLILAPEIEQDITGAYVWYEGQRPGLGEEFLSSVDACLHAILRNPETRAIVFDSYRRALLRRFPHVIFYESAAETVTV